MILQPVRISDLRKVDPPQACEYFNNCFKDPSTFTVVIVGNINPTLALPLILQYLVSGIPFSFHIGLETLLIALTGFVICQIGWNT